MDVMKSLCGKLVILQGRWNPIRANILRDNSEWSWFSVNTLFGCNKTNNLSALLSSFAKNRCKGKNAHLFSSVKDYNIYLNLQKKNPKSRRKKANFPSLHFLFAISLQKKLGIYTILSLVPWNPERYFIFCIHFLLHNNTDVSWNYKFAFTERNQHLLGICF